MEDWVKTLEDLILSLDSTFADLEVGKRKGYLQRDMPLLRATADKIRDARQVQS